MNNLVEIPIQLVNMAFDLVSLIIDHVNLLLTGGATGLFVAPTIGVMTGTTPEGILATTRRRYGSINDRYENIENVVNLLPGEASGHHDRTEATEAIAEVKVKVVNEDFIRVVIDQSSGENAGPVIHGWPPGVKIALIVITATDGKTEVLRQLTTKLHNNIEVPAGSHGKQFIIKAAFLRHIDDKPHFGSEPTFTMPLTTEDLAAGHQAELAARK
jgi:hypothetical protein